MTNSLIGKIALVTGATRGIGKAIAAKLAADGATVIGTATSEKGASTIAGYLGDAGTGMVLNVAEQQSVESTLNTIKEHFGDIDILVNNAGITRDNLLMRMKEEEWQEILDTNLTPIYRLSKAVLRAMMKKRNGRIVNIGSVVGSTGNAGQTNYAAAKAGLIGFTKSLGQEVASRGITVNAVAPGFIDTDMTKGLTDEQKSSINAQIPCQRLGKPEEVAAAVAYLVSDGAAYVTGETLHVNGGMYMG